MLTVLELRAIGCILCALYKVGYVSSKIAVLGFTVHFYKY